MLNGEKGNAGKVIMVLGGIVVVVAGFIAVTVFVKKCRNKVYKEL